MIFKLKFMIIKQTKVELTEVKNEVNLLNYSDTIRIKVDYLD
jgi:hypothetical protein